MQSKYERYYRLLGVGPETTGAQLRRAYREAVKKCHPDLCQGAERAEAERLFMELTDAYHCLYEMAGRRARLEASSTTMGISPQDIAARPPDAAAGSDDAGRLGLIPRVVRTFRSRARRTRAMVSLGLFLAVMAAAVCGALVYSGVVDLGHLGGRDARAAGGDVLTIELPGGVEMKLLLIPAGEFLMAAADAGEDDDAPVMYKATVSRPFYLARTEVTQQQWQAVMRTRPWAGQDRVKEGPRNPATHMSWFDAMLFCRALSRTANREVRLPTETQWEYACRAGGGGGGRYCFGDDEARLGEYAWWRGNAADANEAHAHPVAGRRPNAWGLYDMHGNVWEWCARAGSDDERAERATIRGGSWSAGGRYCRCSSRAWCSPSGRSYDIGFRVAAAAE
ncbi:MAG: SUMF1/EgtB/PvdO family nonheme iron enzyme [Phycisphaerae bacterium]